MLFGKFCCFSPLKHLFIFYFFYILHQVRALQALVLCFQQQQPPPFFFLFFFYGEWFMWRTDLLWATHVPHSLPARVAFARPSCLQPPAPQLFRKELQFLNQTLLPNNLFILNPFLIAMYQFKAYELGYNHIKV